MVRFLLASMTGWVGVLGAGFEVALPYLIRNTALPHAGRSLPAGLPGLRARMSPHYWLGYTLVALVLVHTSFVMGPGIGRSDAIGIWAATLAVCLLFLQLALGLILKSGTGRLRQVRQWHFWSMIGFVARVLTHLLRNG
jgi:hypothetical protein